MISFASFFLVWGPPLFIMQESVRCYRYVMIIVRDSIVIGVKRINTPMEVSIPK